jgi:hypothetical protein
MAFTVTPFPLDVWRNPRYGDRTKRQWHHCVIIFLKTSSSPSGEGPMRQLEFGAMMHCRCWLQPRLVPPRCNVWHGDAYCSVSSTSPSRPCLLLADSSRNMRGGMLVRVVLKSRSYYGVSSLVRDAVRKPCAPLLAICGRMLSKASRLSPSL